MLGRRTFIALVLLALGLIDGAASVWVAGGDGGDGVMSLLPRSSAGGEGGEMGGVDFSKVAMKSVPHKSCNPSDKGCKVVKPLLTATLDLTPDDRGCIPPASDNPVARSMSPAYCVFSTLPQESFWVNLNPNEPNRVMDHRMQGTETGRILLESDLWLKKTAAIYLHPDHALGEKFWKEVYAWVGKGKNGRLCYSLRQWIVPGEIQIAHTVDKNRVTVHLLKATMSVRHESAFEEALNAESGKRSAKRVEAMMDVMCKGANRTLKRHAEETYEALVLPHVEKHVNSAAEYERLRFMFYWRIVSEYAKKLAGRAGLGAAGGGGASGDDEEVPAAAAHPGEEMMGARVSSASGFDAGENLTRIDPIQEEGWTKEVLFRSYLHSVSKGEFLLKRQVEEDGVVYMRTFFHGAINWSDPFLSP